MSTCEGSGKVATPGYCPNDPNNVEVRIPTFCNNPKPYLIKKIIIVLHTEIHINESKYMHC